MHKRIRSDLRFAIGARLLEEQRLIGERYGNAAETGQNTVYRLREGTDDFFCRSFSYAVVSQLDQAVAYGILHPCLLRRLWSDMEKE